MKSKICALRRLVNYDAFFELKLQSSRIALHGRTLSLLVTYILKIFLINLIQHIDFECLNI